LIFFFLEFHVFCYKTYKGTDITIETSGDPDITVVTSGDTATAAKTIEGAEITAETSGASYTKTYGAMTYEEFKAFKFSEHINLNTIRQYLLKSKILSP